MLDGLAEECARSAVIARVNVDEEPSLANRYQIRSIPNLVFFRNGERVDDAIVVAGKEDLVEKL